MKKSLLLLILFIPEILLSQSLSIFDVDASNFPTIKAKFYALDANGNQIRNLTPSDFELLENGLERNVTFVSCPPPKPPTAISSILTIDVSGSMIDQRIEYAKAASRAWIEGLPLGNSECALTTFNLKNYFHQDFTTDRNKLLYAIERLSVGGGTDFDAGFINPIAGALLAAKNGKFKKVVVFITDGEGDGTESAIIQNAKLLNATVYCVSLGFICPPILRNIATQTDGLWFENVTTKEQAEDVYKLILQTAQGGEPCEIEWEGGLNCISGLTNVELQITDLGAKATSSYQRPNASIAKLEFNPTSVKFPYPEIGVKIEKIVTVTARNADFTVTNITDNNAAFTITPKSFVLNNGQSTELTVSYIPADSGYIYVRFDLENDVCSTRYHASGGWRGVRPAVKTLKLIQPNGGEVFLVGKDTLITWDGIPPDEPVKIEYSTNNGSDWTTIVEKTSGLSYNWRVPNTPSDNCIARVTAKAQTSSYCDNPDVEICGKIWMGCNLDVEYYQNGEPIRHARTNAEWIDAGNKKEGAWCYYENSDSLGQIYGKLYNMYAIINPRGFVPEGWRIPTQGDFAELENCLGGNAVTGGKLKSTGTFEGEDGLWKSPNYGATNESWFTAVPGGLRFSDGTFSFLGYYCHWWSSTYSATEAWSRYISNSSAYFDKVEIQFEYGFSVRCIKN
ncbi:MAG: hypothetical protein CVV22_00810 [Ignavibacteriae bacterium HGW-Ignavibacteriae-1]|jgi:uncharacterized protein (TIGR02145 family)|nr:MAG: hypothetical protein CVV22_00810 [Ignavibacteriae bacterium HGW-Ignavibacteriae-1]